MVNLLPLMIGKQSDRQITGDKKDQRSDNMQPDRHCVSADEPMMNVLLDASCLTLVDRGTSFLHDNRY